MIGTTLKRGALLLALILLSGQSAFAFLPAEQNSSLEIPLPAYDMQSLGGLDRDMGTQVVESDLASRYGGSWRVQSWNSWTGTPHFVYGSAPSLRSGIGSDADLANLGLRVVADNHAILRADPDQLRLTATPAAAGKRAVHFQQTYQGLDVWQAKVRLIFSDEGKLMLMGSDYHGDIRLDPNPTLGSDAATQIAVMQLPFDRTTDRVEGEPELLILPVNVSETTVEHHLVWRIRVRTEEPLGAWMTHVDAHSGEIVWRYNDIHFAYSGDTQSDVQPDTWCNGVEVQTMPWLNLNIDGLPTVVTDENGDWSADGTGDRVITAGLIGPWIDVHTNNDGPLALYSSTVYDGTPLQVYFDDSNAQRDERDVFDGVNDIHEFFQAFDPDYSYINFQIGAEVSIASTCNAFWDGDIHFFAAGGGCANTGEIQGVVHHEFGHGIQANLLGSQGNEGLGEGNSDVMANLMTQESIIGRGFYAGNCSNGIRNSDNNLIYPDDVVGQPIHSAGRVMAGFHWDAMMSLQAIYGEEAGTIQTAKDWHFGRMLLQPYYQPDQVVATFVANDDDGDLGNGIPDYDSYSVAAENHNFDYPVVLSGVLFEHLTLDDTMEHSAPYQVEVDIYSTEGPIDPATTMLYWRLEEGLWSTSSMSLVTGDTYTGTIPAQSDGTVEYYFYAEDTVGSSASLPGDAPSAWFSFDVVWYMHGGEEVGGWTVGDFDDDAFRGIWEQVDPVGTESQPEDDHSNYGTMCWITGQATVGGANGESDVDGGKTTLFTPVFNVAGATELTLSYWKWYSNNLGPNPDSDYWDVSLSNDGGATWFPWEHNTNSTNAWVQVNVNLLSYFAEPDQVQIRFVASDEGDGSVVEAGIDDLVIKATFSSTDVLGNAVSAVVMMGQNYPNPFNPTTEISFTLASRGPASLMVYDTQGRLVRTLADGVMIEGDHRVTWNGTDNSGAPVASGVYLYRLLTDGQVLSNRMVLVK
jgi:hypothetical protein